MLITNFPQYDLTDFEDVCRKCQQAYYGDFIAQDCDYCALSRIINDYAIMRQELIRKTSPKDKSKIDPWELEEDFK